ncbi:hypothetical protein PENTCL1PPCAC_26247, partial [Pristionchus entomophagus]
KMDTEEKEMEYIKIKFKKFKISTKKMMEIPAAFIMYRNSNYEDEDSDSGKKRRKEMKMKGDLERNLKKEKEKKKGDQENEEKGRRDPMRSESKGRRESHSYKGEKRQSRGEKKTDLSSSVEKRREDRKRSKERRSRREKTRVEAFHEKNRGDRRRSEERRSRREKSMDLESISDDCDMHIDKTPFIHCPAEMEPAFNTNIIQDLARYAIDHDKDAPFSISSLFNGRKALGLKRVKKTDLSTVIDPLGAAFDRVMRVWIYTDTGNGEIVMASYEGHKHDRMKGFRLPSAIAVITPGSHFAVLDYNGITMVDALHNAKMMVADGFRGLYRGLGTTSDGNLVTIKYKFWPSVCVFNLHKQNTKICSIPYSNYPHNALPSFLCTRREMIYVSDLKRNTLSAFSYSKETKQLSNVTRRDLSNSMKRTSRLRTEYMSGVVADSSHSLLVADAQGGSVNHVSADGSFIQNMPFLKGGHPYISGLALSPTGRLMICCRRQHAVKLYDIVPLESDEDRLTRAINGFSLPSRK